MSSFVAFMKRYKHQLDKDCVETGDISNEPIKDPNSTLFRYALTEHDDLFQIEMQTACESPRMVNAELTIPEICSQNSYQMLCSKVFNPGNYNMAEIELCQSATPIASPLHYLDAVKHFFSIKGSFHLLMILDPAKMLSHISRITKCDGLHHTVIPSLEFLIVNAIPHRIVRCAPNTVYSVHPKIAAVVFSSLRLQLFVAYGKRANVLPLFSGCTLCSTKKNCALCCEPLENGHFKNKHPCPICQETVSNYKEFKDHFLGAHLLPVPTMELEASNLKTIESNIGPYQFKRKSEVKTSKAKRVKKAADGESSEGEQPTERVASKSKKPRFEMDVEPTTAAVNEHSAESRNPTEQLMVEDPRKSKKQEMVEDPRKAKKTRNEVQQGVETQQSVEENVVELESDDDAAPKPTPPKVSATPKSSPPSGSSPKVKRISKKDVADTVDESDDLTFKIFDFPGKRLPKPKNLSLLPS